MNAATCWVYQAWNFDGGQASSWWCLLIVELRIRASFSSQYGGKEVMYVDRAVPGMRRGAKVRKRKCELLTRTLLTLHVEAECLSKSTSLPDG